MIVLDTNVVSELLRPLPNEAVARYVTENSESLAITTITIHEISYGLARLPEGRRRRELTASFRELTESLTNPQILDLTEPAARRSGYLRAHRRSLGAPVDISDSHIAGIVLETGSSLATRNVKDFEHLGLDLIDPWR